MDGRSGRQVAALLAFSLAHQRAVRQARRGTCCATSRRAAVLLADARRSGSTWQALGLAPDTLPTGLRVGAGGALVTVSGTLFAAAVGSRLGLGRALLGDTRADLDRRTLARQVLVRIPVGTAAFEELAFRGVLLDSMERAYGRTRALTCSSLVFGLWHVGPTLAALRENNVHGDRTRAVLGAVAATTLAGGALGAIRLAAGHLVAPTLVHWAVNATGLVAAHRWRTRTASGLSGGDAPVGRQPRS